MSFVYLNALFFKHYQNLSQGQVIGGAYLSPPFSMTKHTISAPDLGPAIPGPSQVSFQASVWHRHQITIFKSSLLGLLMTFPGQMAENCLFLNKRFLIL